MKLFGYIALLIGVSFSLPTYAYPMSNDDGFKINISKLKTSINSLTFTDNCVTDPVFKPATTVCFDSLDGNSYPISATIICKEKSRSPYCTGKPFPYSGEGYDLTQSVINSRTHIIVSFLAVKFGACSTILQNNNLSNLAGNIYSCDQSTGQYTIHTMN